MTVKEAEAIWDSLGDVPTDEEDCIDEDFMKFEKGCHRERIWAWIEEECLDTSIAKLMSIE